MEKSSIDKSPRNVYTKYIRKWGENMETAIQKWGNSQGIRIPKHTLEELQWSDIEQLDISIDNGNMIICKAKKKLPTLSEMCANFKGEYEPIDIDFGEPVGDEIC